MADAPRAALDVGSNTIRLLVAIPEGATLVPVTDQSEFVRLGRGVDESGALQPDREQAALEAIKQLIQTARDHGVDDLVAGATSAVRDASNGEDFVRAVKEETGLEVRILSGDEESRLTYLGATLGIPLPGGAIVVDLGGGSAEIIAADADGVRWDRSLKLGSGRLTERFLHGDPPSTEALDALAQYVDGQLGEIPEARPERAILTGGTATHAALLLSRQGDLVEIDRDDLRKLVELLKHRTAGDLVTQYAIRAERAQVLPAGIRTLLAIADHYQLDDILITRHGIREGMIIDAVQKEGRWPVQ